MGVVPAILYAQQQGFNEINAQRISPAVPPECVCRCDLPEVRCNIPPVECKFPVEQLSATAGSSSTDALGKGAYMPVSIPHGERLVRDTLLSELWSGDEP